MDITQMDITQMDITQMGKNKGRDTKTIDGMEVTTEWCSTTKMLQN